MFVQIVVVVVVGADTTEATDFLYIVLFLFAMVAGDDVLPRVRALSLFILTRMFLLAWCSFRTAPVIAWSLNPNRNHHHHHHRHHHHHLAKRSSSSFSSKIHRCRERQLQISWDSSSSPFLARLQHATTRSFLFASSKSLEIENDDKIENNRDNSNNNSQYYLESLLRTHGYDRRLITLSNDDLPLFVELQDQGQTHVGVLSRIEHGTPPPQSSSLSSSSSLVEPKLHIELSDGTRRVVDVGQLTTIWEDGPTTNKNHENWNNQQSSSSLSSFVSSYPFPVGHVDTALDRLYRGRVGQARSNHEMSSSSLSSSSGGRQKSLTKKQVSQLVAAAPANHANPDHVERVLRQAIKTGANFARLVDSSTVLEYLFGSNSNDTSHIINEKKKEKHGSQPKYNQQNQQQQQFGTVPDEYWTRRALGASILSEDSKLGGRFKRLPCLLVSSSHYNNNNDSDNDASDVANGYLSVMNGGWLVVDQSVRSGTEGRKFAERSSATPQTVADERIAQRLECLAMGQDMGSLTEEDTLDDANSRLELDVREVLKAMDLPPTPTGATQALLTIGRWSEQDTTTDTGDTTNNSKKKGRQSINPWPPTVIEASKWYAQRDQQQRRRQRASFQKTQQQQSLLSPPDAAVVEPVDWNNGRSDLTRFPCVCVDAPRTSFRDDALGVRPRSSTGRKVVDGASKWEILIHIADLSDIYSEHREDDTATIIDDPSDFIQVLRQASLSRGSSRYDLPLGPLHLMPPTVLQSLALRTINPDLTDKKNTMAVNSGATNRCVTVWAYIDERNGKLLDAGVERSIISSPLALSFRSATALLEDDPSNNNTSSGQDPALAKAQALLKVVDRNLQLWREYHNQRNKGSQDKERRMQVKEMIANEMNHPHLQQGSSSGGRGSGSGSVPRDDGRDGFQRSRGHRLVGNSLELYGYAVGGLLRQAGAPFPRASGDASMGIATAPLRRYVDGMAQRQAVSVLCGYGLPMTLDECVQAGRAATDAINGISNVQSTKKGDKQRGGAIRSVSPQRQQQQRQALRALQVHLANHKGPVPAMGTGKQNQVAILGIGAIADCQGIKGSLKPGEKVMVQVLHMDEQRGTISAVLVVGNY
jgi:hypothetical protein